MQRRLTIDEEEKLRAAWKVLTDLKNPWEEISRLQRAIWEMVAESTTNGLRYIEPPLTDEDARQRPWIMVRDNEAEPWRGPRALAACCGGDYYTFTPSACGIIGFRYARRATSEEIAAAGLDTPDA
jgi:hypothetical protein